MDFRQEFIEFALKQNVLRFGEFKTKAGRLSPYFFNAGLFNDGMALDRLSQIYAKAILASGILVLWLGSNVPDLILGIVSALFAANGGREILEHARKASRKPTAPSSEQNTRSTE